MKKLFVTMYHMYFFERTAYWLFAAGLLITIGTQFASPPTAAVGFLFGAIFLAGFPLMWISVLFTFTISNRHLSVVPQWRQIFLGATFCMLFILSMYLSSAYFLFPKKMIAGVNFIGIFMVVFGTSSLLLFIMKYILKNRFIPLILWLVILTSYELVQPFFSGFPKLDNPVLLTIMILCSLSIWLYLIFWIQRVNVVKNAFSNHLHLPSEKVSPIDALSSKGVNVTNLSGLQTLMRGFMYHNNQSRLLSVIIIYMGFPLIVSLLLLLFSSIGIRGEFLLLAQLYVLLFLPTVSGEWLIRLRLLWLKISGDRQQFWLLWKKNLHTDLRFTILFMMIYCFLINLIFEMIPLVLAIYVFVVLIILPSACYFLAWMRLKGGIRSPLAVFLSIGYFLAIAAAILTTLGLRIYTPLLLCGIFFIIVGLFSYIQVKNSFLSIDWVKNRSLGRVLVSSS